MSTAAGIMIFFHEVNITQPSAVDNDPYSPDDRATAENERIPRSPASVLTRPRGGVSLMAAGSTGDCYNLLHFFTRGFAERICYIECYDTTAFSPTVLLLQEGPR